MPEPILPPQTTVLPAPQPPAPPPPAPAPPAANPNQLSAGLTDDRGTQGSVHPGTFPELQPQPAPQPPPEGQNAIPGPVIAPVPTETPPVPAPGALSGARAAAVALGYPNANQFPDDNAFISTLMQAAANGEAYRARLMQLQQAPPAAPAPAQAGLAAQQGVQPAAPSPTDPFKGPEWNAQWEPLIVRNADGSMGLVPGADPAILSKYHAHMAHRRQLSERLLTDPAGLLGPLIDQRAAALAEQRVQQALGQQSAADYVNRFVSENSSWLHVRDAQGGLMINPATNMPFLSATGQKFQGLVQQAEQLGIRDVRHQEAYARQAMQNEYLMAQNQTTLQQQQANAATIAANRRPSQAGTLPRPGQPNVAPPAGGGDLRLMLEQAMAAAGITDQTLLTGNG